jgi:hypothetical protein
MISSAMKVEPDNHILKSTALTPDDQVQEMIIHYCGSLVTVHSESSRPGIVTLVHYSLKEYMENNKIENLPLFQYDLSESHEVLAAT